MVTRIQLCPRNRTALTSTPVSLTFLSMSGPWLRTMRRRNSVQRLILMRRMRRHHRTLILLRTGSRQSKKGRRHSVRPGWLLKRLHRRRSRLHTWRRRWQTQGFRMLLRHLRGPSSVPPASSLPRARRLFRQRAQPQARRKESLLATCRTQLSVRHQEILPGR